MNTHGQYVGGCSTRIVKKGGMRGKELRDKRRGGGERNRNEEEAKAVGIGHRRKEMREN